MDRKTERQIICESLGDYAGLLQEKSSLGQMICDAVAMLEEDAAELWRLRAALKTVQGCMHNHCSTCGFLCKGGGCLKEEKL